MSVFDGLFPACEPYRSGYLAVGEGHEVYWEECGSPLGKPVVFLHGGPGSGCNGAQRRLFDPARYRAILFDQRGCGRSRPLGETLANTTDRLIGDLEKLRSWLDIPAWLVFGGSWGSTLGLAYAQAHPDVVSGLVLRGIFLGSREEIMRYLSPSARPSAWPALEKALGGKGDLLETCYHAIESGHGERSITAATAWLNYERDFMGEAPLCDPPDSTGLAKVRVQVHYLRHDCFLAPGALLRGIERIRRIPAALVQGLADAVCPPAVGERLHDIWPEARWLPISEGGHGGLSPTIAAATMDALEWVASSATGPR